MVLKEIVVNEEFIAEMDKYRQMPKGKSLLEACSESPVLFAEKMLGIRLYAWQVYVMIHLQKALEGNYWTREFAILTSRQIGKSTLLDIFDLWVVIFNKKAAGTFTNSSVGIISATEDQSQKLIREMNKYIAMGDVFMSQTYLDSDNKPTFGKKFLSSLIDEKEANNTKTITFKPWSDKMGQYLLKGSKVGSSIKSYPPTPIILGETFGVVCVDEAGFTEKIDDVFYYDYVYHTGNAQMALKIDTSTPWETSGFFYRLCDPNDEYSEHPAERFLFTIDAIRLENPVMYESIKKQIDILNADGKIDEVRRAYYCQFVKGEKSYFVPDKVREAFTPEQPLSSCGTECDMGIDFGGETTSRTVITISRLNSDGLIERIYHKTYPVQKDLNLIPDIEELMTKFNIQRIIPDGCPAGRFLINLMVQKGWNVLPHDGDKYGMTFRTDKVKKYGAFRAKLNKGLLKSYEDTELRTEMLALVQTEGSQQSYIMHAPGYTDDLVDSWMMSTYYYIEEDDMVFKYYDIDEIYEGESDDAENDKETPKKSILQGKSRN